MKLYELKIAWANLILCLYKEMHTQAQPIFIHSFPNTHHSSIEVMQTPKSSVLITTPTPRVMDRLGPKSEGREYITSPWRYWWAIHLIYDFTFRIFYLCVISFVGIYGRDLRTNHSKEGEDDANLGTLCRVQRRPRCPWIVGGQRQRGDAGESRGVQEEPPPSRVARGRPNHPTRWSALGSDKRQTGLPCRVAKGANSPGWGGPRVL